MATEYELLSNPSENGIDESSAAAYSDAAKNALAAENTLKILDDNENNITSETVVNITINDETTEISNTILNATTDAANAADAAVVGELYNSLGQTTTVDTAAIVNEKVNKNNKPGLASFPGKSAVPTNPNDVPKVGDPTTPVFSRGGENIIGTTIAQRNNQLVHSCDFANDLIKHIQLKKFLKSIARWVREGIRKIMQVLGFTDASGAISSIINALKKLAKELKYIKTEYIDPIIEFQKYVLAVIVKIRAIIQWILSLPAKLLTLLRDCVLRLIKSLVKMFTDEFSGSTGEASQIGDLGKDFQELAAAIKDVAVSGGELLKAGTTVVALAAGIAVSGTVGLLVPTSEAEVIAANATIVNYTGSLPAGLAVPADPDFLKRSIP